MIVAFFPYTGKEKTATITGLKPKELIFRLKGGRWNGIPA